MGKLEYFFTSCESETTSKLRLLLPFVSKSCEGQLSLFAQTENLDFQAKSFRVRTDHSLGYCDDRSEEQIE